LLARKTIERAKGILMKRKGLSEAEAFSLIQRKSMDMRKPMGEIAQAIIVSQEVTKG
jgi:AmiR/NasT family two-component response regulator